MSEFETIVLNKLNSIESRVIRIEETLDEATGFAEGILSNEDGEGLNLDSLNSLKDALTSFMPSQMPDMPVDGNLSNPESLQDLASSLKDFRDRLSGIKTALADIPDETK